MNPEGRNSIIRRFLKLKKESDDLIPKIINDIENQLASVGVKAIVSGREKKPYSIWRKIQDKQQAFYKLSDIFGFRIITINEKDVYTALGAVHSRWSAVPGRFKDYISQPNLMVTDPSTQLFQAEMGKGWRSKLELKRCMM